MGQDQSRPGLPFENVNEYRKKYGSGSKQVNSSGDRVAPWMNIDENMVAKYKAKKEAERKARKQDMQK